MDKSVKGSIDYSWVDTYVFYYESCRSTNGKDKELAELLTRYMKLIRFLIKEGYCGKFRVGTSLYRLILSRSLNHGLSKNQKRIIIVMKKDGIEIAHSFSNSMTFKKLKIVALEEIKTYIDSLVDYPFD